MASSPRFCTFDSCKKLTDVCETVSKALRNREVQPPIHLIKALAAADGCDFLPEELKDFSRLAMKMFRGNLQTDYFRHCVHLADVCGSLICEPLSCSRTWMDVAENYPTAQEDDTVGKHKVVQAVDEMFVRVFRESSEGIDMKKIEDDLGTILGQAVAEGLLDRVNQFALAYPKFGTNGAKKFIDYFCKALRNHVEKGTPVPTETEMMMFVTALMNGGESGGDKDTS